MRYLVLTDIHGNLEALDACLQDASTRRYDRVLVLGDIVGYGADPNAVVERVRALQPIGIVRGNHDKVCCGLESPDGFNAVARAAALWTQAALTAEHRDWIAALPRGPRTIDDEVEICHGSPADEDEYIFGSGEARYALFQASRHVCLFGHTHYPAVFYGMNGQLEGSRTGNPGATVVHLLPAMRYLINPGSVGQPRDGDPRAAYGIVDAPGTAVELFRVEYPLAVAQEKIRAAGLPAALADRLALGR